MRHSKLFSTWLAFTVAAAMAAAIAAWVLRPKPVVESKVVIGTNDEIDYSHGATREDALALGRALGALGFFNNRGTSVLLSRQKGVTILSFVLNEGAWDRPDALANFAEIARRVAPAAGGFPVTVRLVDAARDIRKEQSIGKLMLGERDAIYYSGSATEAQAEALGRALQGARYLGDAGATVLLSRDEVTAISFAVQEGAWNRPETVAGFENLVRQVAGAVGGLPIRLRLLNPEMEMEKEATVE